MPDRDGFTPEFLAQLEELLKPQISRLFPGESRMGFALLAFPFDKADGAHCRALTNARSEDVASLFREMAGRFQGQVRHRTRTARH